MDAGAVDQVRLNLNREALWVINGAIALMMLGVALDLKLEDFKRIFRSPKAPAIGLVSQFILLPAFTFVLTLILRPHPSMALGMILIAACPGGNLSNIMTYIAKGNCAVSISMTAVSTAASVVMTPLNLSVWGRLNPDTAPILRQVSLDPLSVLFTIVCILGIPLVVGISLSKVFPGLADRVRKPFKIFSLCFFILIVAGALVANWNVFLETIGLVAFVVIAHNAVALNTGYWTGRLFGLDPRDVRAVTIEVGIQNSAIGLVLVFQFFEGLGGMAIVAAFWGIWHIIAGLSTALLFSRIPIPGSPNSEPVRE